MEVRGVYGGLFLGVGAFSPAVAIRIAERRERAITAMLGIRTGDSEPSEQVGALYAGVDILGERFRSPPQPARACRVGSRLRGTFAPSIRRRPLLLDKPAWRAGLARDRLTPTGQARGIGMRKYSKILGAFSMSLASLLGFVEACHALGSPVTAINILLEPDATMVQHAQADNARLLKAYPDGFALDATHPRLTMLQQFVRTADLGKVYTAANGFWQRESDKLEPKGVQVLLHPSPAKRHCGHCRRADGESLRLQQALLDAVAPFTERTGTAAAFVSADGGRDIQQGLIDYVANFTTVASGKKFNPHVTIGVAPEAYLNEMLAEPFQTFTFSPVGASVYQLGSFGAARKELQALSLTP